MKWAPHNYQKEAVKFMVSHGCAGLFLDPGLGKTSVTYATFKLLRQKGLVGRMLVVAPLRPAHSVWPGEAQRWDEFQDLKVHVLHGPDKEKLLRRPHDVSVINPEGLSWLFTTMARDGALKWWDMLVIDESTKFKHTNTQRFKLLKPVLSFFRRRYILTGTPAPNGLLDLFGQIYILDLGNALGRFITHYRFSYFDQTGFGGYTFVPKPDAPQKIYERLQPLTLRMSGADYLELPPLIENTVEVELPEKAKKLYDQMELAMIAEVNSEIVTAANAAAATNKCRQIANGGIYTNAEHDFEHIHEAKLDAVEELVEELGGKPCLVAYEYQHDLDRLLRRFGSATPYIGGGVGTGRFRDIEAAWNRGRIPILLAQPQSVAHGLNLQEIGSSVIWHSLTWDLEVYEQFVRRVWRQGQKERVVVHHVVAKGTVDEVMMKALGKKDRTQRALLGALRDYAIERSRPARPSAPRRAG